MQEIKTVGIVGIGVMGSAIGLGAAASGYDVIFKIRAGKDPNPYYEEKILAPLAKRVQKGKITQEQMDAVAGKIKITNQYDDLKDCGLVIESVVETLELKIRIFCELSKSCSEDAILVSNTSTFLIKDVMQKVKHQERTAGLHYFFPANINPLVEIIRQTHTSSDTYEAIRQFAVNNRKKVVAVKDFPGFAINPVFIATYMLADTFFGKFNAATLDDISKQALGVKYGMMWIQNGTGIGTCYHAALSMYNHLHDTDIGFVDMPESLKNCFRSGTSWDLEDGPVIEDPDIRQVVIDRMLGTIFTLCTHLVGKDIISISDLEKGIRYSLAWPKGPFSLMNELGMEKTRQMIVNACYDGPFNMPERFEKTMPAPWEI